MKTSNKVLIVAVASIIAATVFVGGTLAVAATRPGAALPRPIDSVSKVLGLERLDIMRQRMSGKSLTDIAKSKGVDQDKLIATMVAARKARLDAAVKAGRLTQAQADKLLDAYKAAVKTRVTNTAPCTPGAGGGRGGAGGCGGGGCFGGGPGQGAGQGGPGRAGNAGNGAL